MSGWGKDIYVEWKILYTGYPYKRLVGVGIRSTYLRKESMNQKHLLINAFNFRRSSSRNAGSKSSLYKDALERSGGQNLERSSRLERSGVQNLERSSRFVFFYFDDCWFYYSKIIYINLIYYHIHWLVFFSDLRDQEMWQNLLMQQIVCPDQWFPGGA